jgi:hypothetical protein
MRALGILTVRNEGAFLLEWLAHHRATGFTDFLVFSNDCSDGTDTMLDRLATMGWLAHVRNDGPHPEGPQWAALKQADRHPARTQADWLMVLDIDEFVNVVVGDGTLPALCAAVPDATAIAITWRMFGNAGVERFADILLREQFTAAAPRVLWWPWQAAQIKTLFRNDGTFRKLGVHRPKNPDPDRRAVWADGSGRPLPADFARVFHGLGSDPYGLVQINHYALQSMESYVLKADRGRANRAGTTFDLSYWTERNFVAVEDRSILRLAPRTAPILAELHADPVLAPLHRAAVDWRRARFTALMAEETPRQLYGRLMLTGPTRVLSEPEARRFWGLSGAGGG